MTESEPLWKTGRWSWGGAADAPISHVQADQRGWYRHAIYVPGVGWFGGFAPELAAYIVQQVNRAMESPSPSKEPHG